MKGKEFGPYLKIPTCDSCGNYWRPPHRHHMGNPMASPSWTLREPCRKCGGNMRMSTGRYELEVKTSGFVFKSTSKEIIGFHKKGAAPSLKCDCNNVEMGSYDNQIILGRYPVMDEHLKELKPNGISVDRCMVEHVVSLWEAGVRTNGCCCGHKKEAPYISIHEDDFEKAISLGYVKYEFEQPEFKGRLDTITFLDWR